MPEEQLTGASLRSQLDRYRQNARADAGEQDQYDVGGSNSVQEQMLVEHWKKKERREKQMKWRDRGITRYSRGYQNDDCLDPEYLTEALGSDDPDFVNGLCHQLSSVFSDKDGETLSFALSVIKVGKSKNHDHTMLSAQMIAMHCKIMQWIKQLDASTFEELDFAERIVSKLSKQFALHMEVMKRYRMGGERKITVQHVSVNDGGQAIVGNVNQTRGDQKNGLPASRQPNMDRHIQNDSTNIDTEQDVAGSEQLLLAEPKQKEQQNKQRQGRHRGIMRDSRGHENEDCLDPEYLMEAFGSDDPDFVDGLARQLLNIFSDKDDSLSFAISVIKGAQPKDPYEAMLSAQMSGIHWKAMKWMEGLDAAPSVELGLAERIVSKLTKLFASHMETLTHYRMGGETKITVQHVAVNDGGQAIVGNVNQARDDQKRGLPVSRAAILTHARVPAMEIIEQKDPVTIPNSNASDHE
jgi:hypothetical protein